jgi:proteasome accessory factor C
VDRHDDGSQTVTLRTADTLWLHRLLWRLGGRGIVLEPAELAAEVRAGAQEALAAYEGLTGTTPADG